MTPAERRATVGLAGIFGLRMLGMFIVLPVLALYAETLPGGRDHTLVGLALGAYGLTQAMLQIPFGWASDRWGRKPVIVAGLVIFALGSFVAAWAPTIGWTIAGRTVQGAGAISAAVIALTADLTRDAVRIARDGGDRHDDRRDVRALAHRRRPRSRRHRRAGHLRADRRARARRHRAAAVRGGRIPTSIRSVQRRAGAMAARARSTATCCASTTASSRCTPR